MKTTFTLLLIAFLASCYPLFSQSSGWSIPVPVTDSVTDNRNPILIIVGQKSLLFWEKSSDTLSTAIYMRNLHTMSDPVEMLNTPGIHFVNPQPMKVTSGDTLFYLFYETDENGEIDICYKKYTLDGSLWGPYPFFNTLDNEENIRITDDRIVWEQNGTILFSKQDYQQGVGYYFTDPIVIDSGDCHHPVIQHDYIAYIKNIGGASSICCSVYDWQNDVWSAPEVLYDTGYNMSLSLVAWEPDMNPEFMIWESQQDNIWKLYSSRFSTNTVNYEDLQGTTQLMPTAILVDIIVTDEIWPTFLSIVQEDNNNKEIYANDEEWNPLYINISNNENEDTHPYLVLGWAGFGKFNYHVYDIWESYRNGHSQLYMAENVIVAGEKEIGSNHDPEIRIFPNPVSCLSAISFTLKETSRVKLDILNGLGELVSTVIDEEFTPGTHQITWDRGRLPAGVYFCRYQAGAKVETKKIIIM